MSDAIAGEVAVVLPPLMETLEALGFVARHMDPADFDAVMEAAGAPDAALRAVRRRLDGWPEQWTEVSASLAAAADAALAGFDGLRAAPEAPDGVRAVFRALRQGPRALEALYPLANGWPAVSRFFLPSALRGDAAVQARLAAPVQAETGVFHIDNEPGSRGGCSIYVPEYYRSDHAWPLVMALHGGSGNGRAFLWSWLRDARGQGAIVVAPTATGPTWALMGADTDTPNLLRILAQVRGRWNIDPARLLLTGMSDGGTFSYVSGLEADSPFSHLAPVAASFHPMLAEMADPGRVRGLPIHLVHGVLDWMFPVAIARRAQHALAAAGALVTYREIEGLPHCYPSEMNAAILAWLDATR